MKTFTFLLLSGFIALQSCNAPSKNTDDPGTPPTEKSTELLGTYWKVVEINGQPVTNPPADQKEAYIILQKKVIGYKVRVDATT